jgi:hypothetical protein
MSAHIIPFGPTRPVEADHLADDRLDPQLTPARGIMIGLGISSIFWAGLVVLWMAL